MTRQEATVPFVKGKVAVLVDLDRHPALESVSHWGPDLKRKIEAACFAHYRNKVASIGSEALPTIRRPNEIWKHLEIRSLRIDPVVKNIVVIHVVPDWDEEKQMEWCVRGRDQLVYVGQFLGYTVDGYGKASPNFREG